MIANLGMTLYMTSDLSPRYGQGQFTMTQLIKAVFGSFKTKEKLEEVRYVFILPFNIC